MKRPNDISDPTDYEPIAKRLTHYPRHEQKEDEKEVNAVERVARGYYRNDVFHTPLKRVGNYRYAMHAYPDDGEIDVELVIEEVDGTGHWSFRPGATNHGDNAEIAHRIARETDRALQNGLLPPAIIKWWDSFIPAALGTGRGLYNY